MNAVIVSGGKQYRVSAGQSIKLESIPGDVGQVIEFDQVLMFNDGNLQLGSPLVSGVTVSAEIVSQGRHKKIHILKFRRRKHHMKQMGHRQNYTEVKIMAPGATAGAKTTAKKAKSKAKAEE